jgi:hypothetical protein
MAQDLKKPSPMDSLKLTLGVAGALAGVSVIVVMLWILTDRTVSPPQIAGAKTDQERYDILAKARADDRQTLSTFGWISREKGIVRIPIELAMEKLVAENAQQGMQD